MVTKVDHCTRGEGEHRAEEHLEDHEISIRIIKFGLRSDQEPGSVEDRFQNGRPMSLSSLRISEEGGTKFFNF